MESTSVFNSFVRAAHAAIEVIGCQRQGDSGHQKEMPSKRGKKGELAAAATVSTLRLFFVRFCNFLLCGQNDSGEMPGCFFTLLKDLELDQRRTNLSAQKHAQFVRALQEESEIGATLEILQKTKNMFLLFSNFAGRMVLFMQSVWNHEAKLLELEKAWFSNTSVVSFLHRAAVCSMFFHFHGQRLQVLV